MYTKRIDALLSWSLTHDILAVLMQEIKSPVVDDVLRRLSESLRKLKKTIRDVDESTPSAQQDRD